MIKLRIRIPGKADAVVDVDGNEAVIGRSGECEVPLALPYVSKRHAKLMIGVVVCDVGSRNGIWIDGNKLEEPGLLAGATFRLGSDAEKSPEIEVVRAVADDTQQASFVGVDPEKQRLVARVAELEARLEALDGPDATIASPRPGSSRSAQPEAPLPTPIEEEEPERAEQAPVPTPPGAKLGKIPSFQDFFGAARREIRPAREMEPERKAGRGANPAPAVPAIVPAFSRDQQRQRIVEMINCLISEDVGAKAPMIEGPVDEFFTLESFRLLRKVEQVITYLARDMVQLYDVKTMLPNSEGNFRSLAADVLLDPDDRVARQRLVEYLEDLRKWMSVALTANRKAAQQVIRELKKELSAEALAASEPMPALAKALGRADGELWRRAQVFLRELSDEIVDERVELQARKIAGEMLEGAVEPGAVERNMR